MPEQTRPSRSRLFPTRLLSIHSGHVLLIALLVLGAAIHLQNAFDFFMYDDEGGYAYAAWRISLGEVPYRDFLTPQMPGFLYWGGLLVRLFGRTFVPLRLASTLATLLAAGLLYAINRRLFGRAVGLAAVGLFMIDTNVFHNARFYRPEAYMLLLNLAAIYCLILGEQRGRLRYLWLAGLFFGLSITFKLFGLLSLAGCCAYLLYAWWRERRPFRQVLLQGLALGLPVALLAGIMAAVLTRMTPYFFTAVLEHHTMQGAGMSLLERVVKGLRFYRDYVWYQPVLVVLLVWGGLSLRRDRAPSTLMAWQFVPLLTFFVLSRSLMTRHLTYLAPAMATLMALALLRLLQGRWPVWRLQQRWHFQLLALVLTLLALQPGAKLTAADSNQRDVEPFRLAVLVQQLTSPGDVVMADFPGINFAAGRRSTYWAAGISGGAAESGQIRGTMLDEEIERENVAMVIINTRYGAHQMTEMIDYPDFRRYVQARFALVDKYHCAYQQLEIYSRLDTMPLRPDINFQDQVALTGVRLSDLETTSASTLAIDTRWQALSPMPYDYHVSLRLVDATGRLWAQMDEPLVEKFSHREPGKYWDVTDAFRPSTWQAQQVVLQEQQLTIGPAVPTGSYYLVAKVYDLESGFALLPRSGQGPGLPNGDPIIATVRVTSLTPTLSPDALPIVEPRQASLAQGLELLGTGHLPSNGRAGRDLALALFWRAAGRPDQDYRLEFRLLQGETLRQRWPAEVVAGFATSTWRPGELLLGHHALPLDGELPGGSYRLEMQVLDGQGRAAGEAATLVPELEIAPRPDVAAIKAAIGQPLEGVSFGGQIGLLGYDLASQEVQAGGSVGLTLYWECLEPPGKEYKVFTHLLDGAEQIQGQRDAIPDDGNAPTSSWKPGDVLADHYEIPLQTAAQTGPLKVAVGFYDPLTGQRLPLLRDGKATGEDRFILPSGVTVR